jgi:hypothetical protein
MSPGFGNGLDAVTILRLAPPGAAISHFFMSVMVTRSRQIW